MFGRQARSVDMAAGDGRDRRHRGLRGDAGGQRADARRTIRCPSRANPRRGRPTRTIPSASGSHRGHPRRDLGHPAPRRTASALVRHRCRAPHHHVRHRAARHDRAAPAQPPALAGRAGVRRRRPPPGPRRRLRHHHQSRRGQPAPLSAGLLAGAGAVRAGGRLPRPTSSLAPSCSRCCTSW